MTHTLTGKKRHRAFRTLFGGLKFVLQVEVRVLEERLTSYGYDDSYTYLTWRDAKFEDLTEIPAC